MMISDYLGAARTIVVKIGSSLLIDGDSGRINQAALSGFAADLAMLHGLGCRCIVVSSGAIALGRHRLDLGLAASRLKIEDKQAAAAVGQVYLSHEWTAALDHHSIATAQILLSFADTEERRRHLNARATMSSLLSHGVIPIVNENDTVATAEIRYGDNDRLAARVAQMVSADMLLLLSDIDGLYSADPKRDSAASFIDEVTVLSDDIRAMAGPAQTDFSSGGMITKIEAARIAMQAGCHMVISDGRILRPINHLFSGGRGTCFVASSKPLQARKMWIGGGLQPQGSIDVDGGASAALYSGKSLLAAGIVSVSGDFARGDLISVRGKGGLAIGRGLVNYSSSDIAAIAGRKSSEIRNILGYTGRDEVIHADDLVMD